jgi:hypothetical protein
MGEIYQMTTKYTETGENIPNVHRIFQIAIKDIFHFPFQGPPK